MKNRLPLLCLLAVSLACTAPRQGAAPSAASASASAPPPAVPSPTSTPTAQQRINSDVVEDTPTYRIQRYRKSEYAKTDERHIRSPLIP